MGDISCDLLLSGNIPLSIYVYNIDTTHKRIKSFKSIDNGCETIRHIFFNRGKMTKFPCELGEIFPNLKFIDIWNCGLKKISKDDLKSFPMLERLDLERNKLKFVPGDLFENNPKIRIAIFSKNKIETIGVNLLDNLKNLEEANFSKNAEIDVKYSIKSDFNDLEKLKEIFKNDCPPVKSLQKLASKALIKSRDIQNVQMVKFIADRMHLMDLSAKIVEKVEKEKGWRILSHNFCC